MFRPMRRFKQQLSAEKCIDILKNEPRGVLAVLGDEGYPYAVPLNFVYDDGKLYFHCAKEGHKLDAVKSCEKASFCVLDKGVKDESGRFYYFNSVICFGKIKILSEKKDILEKAKLLGMKYYAFEAEVDEEIRKFADRVCMLEMEIKHMSGKHVHEK